MKSRACSETDNDKQGSEGKRQPLRSLGRSLACLQQQLLSRDSQESVVQRAPVAVPGPWYAGVVLGQGVWIQAPGTLDPPLGLSGSVTSSWPSYPNTANFLCLLEVSFDSPRPQWQLLGLCSAGLLSQIQAFPQVSGSSLLSWRASRLSFSAPASESDHGLPVP